MGNGLSRQNDAGYWLVFVGPRRPTPFVAELVPGGGVPGAMAFDLGTVVEFS